MRASLFSISLLLSLLLSISLATCYVPTPYNNVIYNSKEKQHSNFAYPINPSCDVCTNVSLVTPETECLSTAILRLSAASAQPTSNKLKFRSMEWLNFACVQMAGNFRNQLIDVYIKRTHPVTHPSHYIPRYIRLTGSACNESVWTPLI